MLAIMLAFFGVVIAVNVGMARLAMGSFSGVVVDNSYDASQRFNHWLDQAAEARALGWTVTPRHRADGRVVLSFTSHAAPLPATARAVAEATHPLGDPAATTLRFVREGQGENTYVSTAALGPGRWQLRLHFDGATGTAAAWRSELTL
jgi:nitrogen fixation protein FixH